MLLDASGLSKSHDTDVQRCNASELISEITLAETGPSGFCSWKPWPLLSLRLHPADELDIVTNLQVH